VQVAPISFRDDTSLDLWADGVDDIADVLDAVRAGDDRLPGFATGCVQVTFMLQSGRPGGFEDGVAYAPAVTELVVGGVDDRAHVQVDDVVLR